MKIVLDTSKLFRFKFRENQNTKLGRFYSKLINFIYPNCDMIVTVGLTLIAFFVMFGFTVLDVYNTDFVLVGGDFTVSYLGSVFYRLDEWRWPIFTHMNLAYPYGISVHGTDGSPLLSLIFKVFHKFFGLSAETQFVGIWMLISYTLQAVFSVLIFRKAFKNKFLVIIGALFFVTAPIMLMRVFVHINLMCQFILLWAIYLWLNDKLTKNEWLAMGIILSLATLTCPYFLPMVGGFFFILILKKYWFDKEVRLGTILWGITCLACVFLFWFYLLGMVEKEQVLTSGGWRLFGLNLAALFNPIWSQSRVFSAITPRLKDDFDADNYFGFGLLILLIMFFPHIKHLFKMENLKKNALIALLLAGFFIYSLSSQVKYGTLVLVDYNPGPIIDWIGSVFRYSGRFFWPIWYLLAFFLIKTAGKTFPQFAYLLLPFLLVVQIWDLYPNYKGKSDYIRHPYTITHPFKSEEWDRLDKQYKNVFIFAHNDNYRDMWRWAIRHNKNVNYGFLNRPSSKTEKLVNQVRENILAGFVPFKEYFYLIDSDLSKRIDEAAKLNPSVEIIKSKIKNIDGFQILEYDEALAQEQENFKKVEIPVTHKYWTDTLVQTSPYRLYRNVDNKFTDYATILDFDDVALNLRWDKYGEEYFQKESDGRYHQVDHRVEPQKKKDKEPAAKEENNSQKADNNPQNADKGNNAQNANKADNAQNADKGNNPQNADKANNAAADNAQNADKGNNAQNADKANNAAVADNASNENNAKVVHEENNQNDKANKRKNRRRIHK